MARILFTVCGVGMGHAGRSEMIIRELKKKHRVKILSYGSGEKFLKTNFRVGKLEWFKLFFVKDRYKHDATVWFNLPKLPKVFFKNLVTLTKIVEEFRPDVIISDFDVNGIYIAKLFNIPSITISNMHITNFIKVDLKLNEKIVYLLNHKTMLQAFSPTDYLLVVYPFIPKRVFKNVEFFRHLVREDFLDSITGFGDYFLVYSTPSQLETIVPLLKQIPNEKFIVRGTDGKSTENVFFKPKLSEKEFTIELKNCRGVICHGGLSIISEAITLKKPVYVFSDMQFFERYYNGKIVEKMGFGLLEQTPTLEGLKKFIGKNNEYREELLEKNTEPANKEFLKKLDGLVIKFARKKKNLATRLKELRRLIEEQKPAKLFKKILSDSYFNRVFKKNILKSYNELIKEKGPEK